MNKQSINLIATQAQIILDEAKNLRGKNLELYNKSHVEYVYYLDTIDILVKQINNIAPKVNELFKKEGIDYQIPEIKIFDATLEEVRQQHIISPAEPKLLKLIFTASNILTFIKGGLILSESTQNRLDCLSEEIDSIRTEIGEPLSENLTETKDTLEKGCLLGSSLISGKIIRASFDVIPGKDINDKIETLKRFGLVREKDGKDSLLKANHYGRNLASHNLKIMPSASETIAFLAEALKIVKIVSEYQKVATKEQGAPKSSDTTEPDVA